MRSARRAGLFWLCVLGACAGTRSDRPPVADLSRDAGLTWPDLGWTSSHDAARDSARDASPTCTATCAGCCSSSGACGQGLSNTACGKQGALCVDCAAQGTTCVEGSCAGCKPVCAGKLCGAADGCGGNCASGSGCCSPACAGKQCGPDGCGGSCGTCASSKVCQSGTCACADPITADPTGCVKATCTGWPSPQVNLTWCGQPNQSVNAVQRGEGRPTDTTFSWQAIWGDPTLLLRAWTDTSVKPNVTYTYRIKFAPDLPSNNVTVPVNACNCGG